MSTQTHKPNKRLLPLCLIVTLGLQGCAGNGTNYNPTLWTAGDWGKCALAIAAGAAAGAAVSGDKGMGIGALAGVAACFVINAKTVQTHTAAQIEEQYRQQNRSLPQQPQVVDYQTSIRPGTTVQRGQPLQIVSNIAAISGTNEPIREIKEEVRLYEPGATTPFKEGSKVASQTPGSGGFENTFTVTLNDQVPQGVYRVETSLLLNGKRINSHSNNVQLVMNEQGSYNLALLSN